MSTTSPAEQLSTPVDGVAVLGSLSPSRASDFMTCPLLYRFRSVDRLPEPPSPDAVRGTLVHKILEDLFDRPAPERTPTTALGMLEPAWVALQETEPELAEMLPESERERWLSSCRTVLERYFTIEDPTRLEPAERELYVESLLDSKLLLRGFIDRLEIAPDGAVRITDYKSGRAPRPGFEAKALFQMRFYALVTWRVRGEIPKVLQLLYLGSGDVLRYEPDEADLRATERKVIAIWQAIRAAEDSGDWRPSPSRLCSWCSHQELCPSFGGTPPPLRSAPEETAPEETAPEETAPEETAPEETATEALPAEVSSPPTPVR